MCLSGDIVWPTRIAEPNCGWASHLEFARWDTHKPRLVAERHLQRWCRATSAPIKAITYLVTGVVEAAVVAQVIGPAVVDAVAGISAPITLYARLAPSGPAQERVALFISRAGVIGAPIMALTVRRAESSRGAAVCRIVAWILFISSLTALRATEEIILAALVIRARVLLPTVMAKVVSGTKGRCLCAVAGVLASVTLFTRLTPGWAAYQGLLAATVVSAGVPGAPVRTGVLRATERGGRRAVQSIRTRVALNTGLTLAAGPAQRHVR
jgi:hypothetical protein